LSDIAATPSALSLAAVVLRVLAASFNFVLLLFLVAIDVVEEAEFQFQASLPAPSAAKGGGKPL
jgi:hypothetical protein